MTPLIRVVYKSQVQGTESRMEETSWEERGVSGCLISREFLPRQMNKSER